jgi:hypothetical protein
MALRTAGDGSFRARVEKARCNVDSDSDLDFDTDEPPAGPTALCNGVMHLKFAVLLGMVGFNSFGIAPVIGCDDRSSLRTQNRFFSEVVGKSEPMENIKKRNLNLLAVSQHPLQLQQDENINQIVENHKIFLDEHRSDVRECQHGEGCQKQATFGNINESLPSFCVKHALRGSVFLKRGHCRFDSDSSCTPIRWYPNSLPLIRSFRCRDAGMQKDVPDPHRLVTLYPLVHCSARNTNCNFR